MAARRSARARGVLRGVQVGIRVGFYWLTPALPQAGGVGCVRIGRGFWFGGAERLRCWPAPASSRKREGDCAWA